MTMPTHDHQKPPGGEETAAEHNRAGSPLEPSEQHQDGRRGIRAQLPGAATTRWLIAAWNDSGGAAAAAAELGAIAAAALLLTYAGTIIAVTGACAAGLFALRAITLSRTARRPDPRQ